MSDLDLVEVTVVAGVGNLVSVLILHVIALAIQQNHHPSERVCDTLFGKFADCCTKLSYKHIHIVYNN